MITRLLVGVVLLVAPSPVAAVAHQGVVHDGAALAQTSPTTGLTSPSPSPTVSPSPGPGDEGGIATGAGIVVAAILIGGLLLMRSKLLRR